jgi:putative hemolysin
MLGCVSLEETEPAVGWALYEYIKRTYSMCEKLVAVPRAGFELEQAPGKEINKFLLDEPTLKKHIPPLFKGYLRLGARICGEPAFDSEFGTIDFFILVDTGKIPERYTRHFKYIRKI